MFATQPASLQTLEHLKINTNMRSPLLLESPEAELLDVDDFFDLQGEETYHAQKRRGCKFGTEDGQHRHSAIWPTTPPTSRGTFVHNIATELTAALHLLVKNNDARQKIYGLHSDESRLGYMPPETRARFNSDEATSIRECMQTVKATSRTKRMAEASALTPRTVAKKAQRSRE